MRDAHARDSQESDDAQKMQQRDQSVAAHSAGAEEDKQRRTIGYTQTAESGFVVFVPDRLCSVAFRVSVGRAGRLAGAAAAVCHWGGGRPSAAKGKNDGAGKSLTEGRRRATDGNRRVSDGNSRVTDGRWRVTDGRWRVTDGRWRVTDSSGQGMGRSASPDAGPVVLHGPVQDEGLAQALRMLELRLQRAGPHRRGGEQAPVELRVRGEEHVGVGVRDVGVPADDVGEARAPDLLQLLRRAPRGRGGRRVAGGRR